MSWIIPVQEMNVKEGGASQMRCEVSFQLPDGVMAVWRFADEVHGRTSRGLWRAVELPVCSGDKD